MSFTYTRNIPFETNTPAQDQPNMKVNNNSIDDWTNVDHFKFSSVNAGKHQKITFPVATTVPTLSNGQTQIYPFSFGSGTSYSETYCSFADSAGNQINGYMPIIKAMAQFTVPAVGSPAPLITANTLNFNVASVSRGTGGLANSFIITFTTALPYNTYYVFAFSNLIIGSGNPFTTFPIHSRTTTQCVIEAETLSGTQSVGFMVI